MRLKRSDWAYADAEEAMAIEWARKVHAEEFKKIDAYFDKFLKQNSRLTFRQVLGKAEKNPKARAYRDRLCVFIEEFRQIQSSLH